jgi:hypothetical protein
MIKTKMKERNNKLLGLFLLSLLLITLTSNLVIAAEEGLTSEEETFIRTIVANPVIKILTGNPGNSLQAFIDGYGQDNYDKMPLGEVGVIIIHIVFWLMLAFAFSDIFESFLPFKNKYVPWVLGFGLTIIVANLGVIHKSLLWLAYITSWAGAFAIFLSMLIAFGAFILVAFFGNVLKVKMIRRKIELAGETNAAHAKAGIEVLKGLTELK